MSLALAHVRRDYRAGALTERGAPAEPFALFARWLKTALNAGMLEPTAMALASADARGRPSARIVLLKGFDAHGFTFFTSYGSRKGRELDARRRASLALWWPPLQRQVRIEGRVMRVSRSESDAYFAVRPRGAQLGAWASNQSRRIPDRRWLRRRLAEVTRRFAGGIIPRPEHWGGYRVTPGAIEFWQGRRDRLHDRLLYTRSRGGWTRQRLAP